MEENNSNDSDSEPGVGNNNSNTETGGVINKGSSVCLLSTTQVEFNGSLTDISIHKITVHSTTPVAG